MASKKHSASCLIQDRSSSKTSTRSSELANNIQDDLVAIITKKILAWYSINARDLPWRKTQDPYKILVSELMLQQTQVPRVIPKYNAFLKRFPTIHSLAAADRKDVLQHWQGLGYNNRAVRLHALAKLIVAERAGKLPQEYDELRKLPGIGPYTAGAIMNFAHNKYAPCIDVNISRVVSRVSFSQKELLTKEQIAARAESLAIASKEPRAWHNALMDFGSDICTAKNPQCNNCPLAAICKSKGVRADEFATGAVSKKQTKFKDSIRYYRGQLLKELLKPNPALHTKKSLFAAIEGDLAKKETALVALEKEKLVLILGNKRDKIKLAK